MAEQSILQLDFLDPRVKVRAFELRGKLGRMPTGKEIQDSLIANPPKESGELTVFNPDMTTEEAEKQEVANIRLNKNLPVEEPGDMSEKRIDYDQKQQDLETLGLADVFGDVGEVFSQKFQEVAELPIVENLFGGPDKQSMEQVNRDLELTAKPAANIGKEIGAELINTDNPITNFMGGDDDPPPGEVPITQSSPDDPDPVVEVRETIEEKADQFRETFPEVVETIVEKVPVTKQEAMDLVKDIAPLIVEKLGVTPPKKEIEEITLEAEPKNISAEPAEPAKGTAIVESVRTTAKPPELTQTEGLKISLDDIPKFVQNKEIADIIKRVEYKPFFQDGVEQLAIQEIDRRVTENNKKLEKIGQRKLKPFFGKEDTGRKILAAIAAGLGAYASAITGGPNSALNIINKAIDDDLAIQKEQFERERMSIQDQNVLLAERRSQLYKEAEMKMQEMIAQVSTDIDKAKLLQEQDILAQKADGARLDTIEALIAASAEGADKTAEKMIRTRTGYAMYGPSKSEKEILKEVDKVNKFFKGTTMMLGDPEAEDEDSRIGALQRVIDIAEKHPIKTLIPGTQPYRDLRSTHNQLKSWYQRDYVGTGMQLTINEERIVDNVVGKTTLFGIASGDLIDAMKILKRDLLAQEKNFMKIMDINPSGKQATFKKYNPQAKGKLVSE
jgi:hypothetical protein